MRNRQSAPRSGAASTTAGYPAASHRHPNYMYGRLSRGESLRATGRRPDDAMLGLHDDADAAGYIPHSHRHADVMAADGHAFMFGGDPARSRCAAANDPAFYDPAFYFWGAGQA